MKFTIRKQKFEIYNPKIQYYISNGVNNYLTKDGTISKGAKNGWWHSKKEAEIFLAGWLSLQPTPEFNADQVDYEPQFELGIRHIQYIDGVRVVHRYYKLDGGVVAWSNGYDPPWVTTFNNIKYIWRREQ